MAQLIVLVNKRLSRQIIANRQKKIYHNDDLMKLNHDYLKKKNFMEGTNRKRARLKKNMICLS